MTIVSSRKAQPVAISYRQQPKASTCCPKYIH